jgi:hypothetical protein
MTYNYFRHNAVKDLIELADYPDDAPAARELAERIVDNIERYIASKVATRLPEVMEYARRRNIDLNQAIQELVNSGLSHHPESLLP